MIDERWRRLFFSLTAAPIFCSTNNDRNETCQRCALHFADYFSQCLLTFRVLFNTHTESFWHCTFYMWTVFRTIQSYFLSCLFGKYSSMTFRCRARDTSNLQIVCTSNFHQLHEMNDVVPFWLLFVRYVGLFRMIWRFYIMISTKNSNILITLSMTFIVDVDIYKCFPGIMFCSNTFCSAFYQLMDNNCCCKFVSPDCSANLLVHQSGNMNICWHWQSKVCNYFRTSFQSRSTR